MSEEIYTYRHGVSVADKNASNPINHYVPDTSRAYKELGLSVTISFLTLFLVLSHHINLELLKYLELKFKEAYSCCMRTRNFSYEES